MVCLYELTFLPSIILGRGKFGTKSLMLFVLRFGYVSVEGEFVSGNISGLGDDFSICLVS